MFIIITENNSPLSLQKSISHEKFMTTALTVQGKVKQMGVGRFGARKVIFENGVIAVLKPKLFSNETFRGIDRDTQYLREVAAYQLDWKLLKFNVVPPTTLTMYENEPASIQAWEVGFYAKEIVSKPFDHNSDDWKARLALFASKVNIDDLRKIILLDLIINNTDRHAKNCLFDTFSDKVWAIDHGLTFGRYYKNYFNVFHREIFRKNFRLEKEERELLDNITYNDLETILGRYISAKEIKDTFTRIRWILEQSNLGFEHVSKGNYEKNEFPSYKEYFNKIEHPKNKVIETIDNMSVF
jgi:hypothetical protein